MSAHILTIDELHRHLSDARKKGLGKKKIMLSDDDEGNGYHLMFFGVTPAKDCICDACQIPYGVSVGELKDYVVIG